MGIKQICETVTNYFNNSVGPFPQLPRALLVCSMIKRPGLSVIRSVTNITKDLNKLGIPTGPMPDGSANLTVGVMFASTKEIYRGVTEDASIQGAVVPASANVVVAGVGGGAGTIVNAPRVLSKMS